ncbi:MAG: hypothetical protein K0Q73_4478 [Paenibacillus sp.]|nr:hypothetical protein [Paenibacillus sp.]
MLKPILSGHSDAVSPGIACSHAPLLIGYGQTLNKHMEVKWRRWRETVFPAPILPGACLALERSTFFDVDGFERGFNVWGFEDIELSIKLWLHGYTCSVQPEVTVLHVFRLLHPYTVTSKHIYYNLMRMAYSHFNNERIEKCKKLANKSGELKEILPQLLESDVMEQRKRYVSKRKYDDNWFFKKFRIPF